MDRTVDHTISRRKQKKMAKNLESGKFATMQAEKEAAKRNARGRRLHGILKTPGRGGLTAKGAAQLQQFFSKKVPQSHKPKLGEMDESASAVLLQMTAEETDAKDLSYEELRKLAEETVMTDGPGRREKAEGEDRKAEEDNVTEGPMEVEGKEEDGGVEVEEDVVADRPMEVEDEEVGDEDEEQGGVVLAKDW